MDTLALYRIHTVYFSIKDNNVFYSFFCLYRLIRRHYPFYFRSDNHKTRSCVMTQDLVKTMHVRTVIITNEATKQK